MKKTEQPGLTPVAQKFASPSKASPAPCASAAMAGGSAP